MMLPLRSIVFIHGFLGVLAGRARQDAAQDAQDYATTEWSISDLDLENDGWALSTPAAATTASDRAPARPAPAAPAGGTGDIKQGRRATRAPGTAPPTPTRARPARPRGEGEGESRPNYFLTVTVPWTVGMLTLFLVFLWLMRTDGPVYHCLTQSYTPPAVREQAAEERRRERLDETEETAQNAWETERERWRKQRPSRLGASTTPSATPSASPSVTWAEPPVPVIVPAPLPGEDDEDDEQQAAPASSSRPVRRHRSRR